MLDSIQPTPLRIFIRWLVFIVIAVGLTLVGVNIETMTGLSLFWVGWISAFAYCVIFPSMAPGFKE